MSSKIVDLIKKSEKNLQTYKQTIFNNMSPALFPDNYSKTRFLNNVIQSIRKNPKVAECTQESIMGSIVECATVGLTPDGITGLAHLVPFKDRVRGLECQLVIGYKGYRKLALRNTNYVSFEMRSVFKADFFEYEFGLDPKIVHKPGLKGLVKGVENELTHVYAYVVTKSGYKIFDVMTRAEVEAVRDSTKKGPQGKINPVWNNNFPSMAMKTVSNRLANKQLDLEADVARIFTNDDLAMRGMSQKNDTHADLDDNSAIDADYEEVQEEKKVDANEKIAEKSSAAQEHAEKLIDNKEGDSEY